MLKKTFLFLCIFNFAFFIFAQNTNNSKTIKFLKGNISDKTVAVREASGNEAVWLSNKAIDYSIENKAILGNDRDLDGLAVAAVLSISNDYVKTATEAQKTELSNKLNQIYTDFQTSKTVEIAILTKIVTLKDSLPLDSFVKTINNNLKTQNLNSIDSSVLKTTLTALNQIGNAESFIIIYYFYSTNKYEQYNDDFEKTLIELSLNSMTESINIIQDVNFESLRKIYGIYTKNSKISKNNLCTISEIVLNKSILLMGNSLQVSKDDIDLQITALKTLSENKWTRASTTALSYFQIAEKLYEAKTMNSEDFTVVISSLSSITPVTAVSPLTSYLEELNRQKEAGADVASDVVLSVIKTLGAIGDKSAFDSLLAVTYLNYEESILSAAREALAGLRWQ